MTKPIKQKYIISNICEYILYFDKSDKKVEFSSQSLTRDMYLTNLFYNFNAGKYKKEI